MNTHILIVLSRRLDAAFAAMETTWADYKDDRDNAAKLWRYTSALRRAGRLHQSIKALS